MPVVYQWGGNNMKPERELENIKLNIKHLHACLPHYEAALEKLPEENEEARAVYTAQIVKTHKMLKDLDIAREKLEEKIAQSVPKSPEPTASDESQDQNQPQPGYKKPQS